MRVQEGLCVLGACLVCQNLESCYSYTLFYCLLVLSCGECDVISLYSMCGSVNGSVCLVCCVFASVCELFHQTIHNIFC